MWEERLEERLKRYENILKSSPILYKAAQAADKSETAPETVRSVCSYVLAPSLCAYVVWVLEEALKSDKKRLYFLARDAYFMYETAKLVCEAFNLPIECRYLSCSRFSVRIPMYHLDLEEALDYICRGGIDVTPEKILNRAGICEEEKENVFAELEKSGNFDYEKEELIPYAQLAEVKKTLKKSPLFMEYTAERSKAAMPAFEGYLRQEGLFDGTDAAFVDSGWVGSMQKVLNSALEFIAAEDEPRNGHFKPLEGYYWGLYELPEGVNPKSYHCYYFSPGKNIREKICFSNCLYEAVFSAPHGMTLEYEEKDGKYFPVYGEISEEQKGFMQECRICFADFTGALISQTFENNKNTSGKEALSFICVRTDKKIIYRLLKCFMGEPCAQEADVFGSLHFSDDVIDYKQQNLAAELTQEELKANHGFAKILSMTGLKKGHIKESAWYEASAVRAGINVKRHLKGYRSYKRLLYIRKRHIWRKTYGKIK